jgi:hypothetical protein
VLVGISGLGSGLETEWRISFHLVTWLKCVIEKEKIFVSTNMLGFAELLFEDFLVGKVLFDDVGVKFG